MAEDGMKKRALAEFSTGTNRRSRLRGLPCVPGADLLQFVDHPLQLVNNPHLSRGLEYAQDRVVIPDLQIAAAFEPLPHLRPDQAIVFKYRARVVELVCGGDQPYVGGFVAEPVDVRLLSLLP